MSFGFWFVSLYQNALKLHFDRKFWFEGEIWENYFKLELFEIHYKIQKIIRNEGLKINISNLSSNLSIRTSLLLIWNLFSKYFQSKWNLRFFCIIGVSSKIHQNKRTYCLLTVFFFFPKRQVMLARLLKVKISFFKIKILKYFETWFGLLQ